jgi:hypothetical protein
MTSIELHQPPRFRQVVREQFKSIALVLRFPAIVTAGLATVATFLAVADFVRGRGGVEFAPELSMIPAFAGALLPVALWFSERRFGAGFFWTLPVDRIRHAIARIFAGWLWLMIGVTAFMIWLLMLALLTKGNITGDELIRLLPSSTVPPSGTLDPSALRTIRWVPEPAFWLVPFCAATGIYAIASALTLGLRYPLRWIAGIAATAFLFAAVGQGLGSDALWFRVTHLIQAVMFGRYGLDGLLTAHTESLKTAIRLSTGVVVTVWKGLPVISEWIVATLLWTGIGLTALSAAVFRHRETR